VGKQRARAIVMRIAQWRLCGWDKERFVDLISGQWRFMTLTTTKGLMVYIGEDHDFQVSSPHIDITIAITTTDLVQNSVNMAPELSAEGNSMTLPNPATPNDVFKFKYSCKAADRCIAWLVAQIHYEDECKGVYDDSQPGTPPSSACSLDSSEGGVALPNSPSADDPSSDGGAEIPPDRSASPPIGGGLPLTEANLKLLESETSESTSRADTSSSNSLHEATSYPSPSFHTSSWLTPSSQSTHNDFPSMRSSEVSTDILSHEEPNFLQMITNEDMFRVYLETFFKPPSKEGPLSDVPALTTGGSSPSEHTLSDIVDEDGSEGGEVVNYMDDLPVGSDDDQPDPEGEPRIIEESGEYTVLPSSDD
jgi:hypothetical protein